VSKLFETLELPPDLLNNLFALGYRNMTAIQEKSLPIVLCGKDLIAQAKTGSGKTAAFGIPMIMKINTSQIDPQALVICPTRELAEQVAKELRRLGRWKKNLKILTLCGGMPMRPQMRSLEHGADIVVGTPGRILDHLSKESLSLKKIQTVVLDEADRMLEMGFYEEIEKILYKTAQKRQTLLFSATFPSKIKTLSSEFMRNPVQIIVESEHEAGTIEEIFYDIAEEEKDEALMYVLQLHQPESVIVFVNTKIDVITLTERLIERGFSALDLHGDLEQIDRTQTLLQFANRSVRILVATDLAARGLDIKEVEMVLNLGLPRKKEDYIHRIGRTARAGNKGKAVTLVPQDEKYKLQDFTDKKPEKLNKDEIDTSVAIKANMKTLSILGGKKQKLRAGDILGTLCKEIGLEKSAVGKIDIFDFQAYVAIEKEQFEKALQGLQKVRIKNRKFKVVPL
jgi:ATP-independent RNA helicase DbpA